MSRRQTLLLLLANALVAALLYGPALHGAPISDDQFVLNVPELQTLGWANLRAIFDPTSPVAPALCNYAPVHALLHALEFAVFGHDLLALHLVNVGFHALVTTLLVALFVRTGIPLGAALLGGAVFLVHPANVEAVAWMSQLKTTSSMALALGALLVHRRRPWLATVLFAFSLLAKAQGAVALPVLVVLEWTRDPGTSRHPAPRRWLWPVAWAAIFVAFAAVEAPVLVGMGTMERAPFEADRLLHLRTMIAIAGRYLAMAATSFGTSTLHEPPPAASWLDPWWIGGLVALLLLALRAGSAFRERRTEAAYWTWAAVSYAPVSQVLTFSSMMADRYLYAVLPGLIGALLLGVRDALARIPDATRRRRVADAAVVATAALASVFAVRVVRDRAPVWRHESAYYVDAALHYPDGVVAQVLRARGCARIGDADCAVAALRGARAKGWMWVGVLFTYPEFAKLRSDPAFQALIREVTESTVARQRASPPRTAREFESLARLYMWRGEPAEARAALARAHALGGGRARQAGPRARATSAVPGPDGPPGTSAGAP